VNRSHGKSEAIYAKLLMRISARNQLAGRVESVNADDVMAEVIVRLQGGETIVSAITAHSAHQLGLVPGKAVTVLVKSTEVMLAVAD
jgi:molybdate transport system regulatory protein